MKDLEFLYLTKDSKIISRIVNILIEIDYFFINQISLF